tara:strand:+ start:1819 stop:2484 length:666 start_codon:yes stop_codon:yes gene_type:complete
MATFQVQIEDMIGGTSFNDDGFITQAIQDVGAEIVSLAPIPKLMKVGKTVAISSGGLNISSKRILAVDKSDYRAREIFASDKARYKSAGSIYASSDTSPVFYTEDQNLFVIGDAASNETSGTLCYVPLIPTYDGDNSIVYSSTGVEHFPKEAVHILVLGAAAKCLQQEMALKSEKLKVYIQTDEDSELAQVEMLEINAVQAQLTILEGKYMKSLEAFLKSQ